MAWSVPCARRPRTRKLSNFYIKGGARSMRAVGNQSGHPQQSGTGRKTGIGVLRSLCAAEPGAEATERRQMGLPIRGTHVSDTVAAPGAATDHFVHTL
jgi:hypothetical protein